MTATFHLEETPCSTDVVVNVVSCTKDRIVVMIPSWSADAALVIRRDGPHFPRITGSRPAVKMRYRCRVDFNGPFPVIRSWAIAEVQPAGPRPLPPPNGLPGPPDQLPVFNAPAMDRIIKRAFKGIHKDDVPGIRYLISRAHGQGLNEAISSRDHA